MEVGIIAPIKMLSLCKTRTHYVLPSLLLESEEYLTFYIERQKEGHKIIIDCRKLGWKREPEDISIINKSADTIRPTSIILPSCMYDKKKTIIEVKQLIESLRVPSYFVGCLEGSSLTELEECRNELRKLDIVEWALPAHCYRFSKGIENIDYYIDNWEDPLELKDKKGLLLTSLPVRLGLQGRLLSNYKPTPPLLTFKEDNTQFRLVIEKNIKELIEYYAED